MPSSNEVLEESLTSAATGQSVVSHEILSDLGKGPLKRYLTSTEWKPSTAQLSRLWNRIWTSALSPEVKDKHLTAACNALCVFLQCGAASSWLEVREFSFSKLVWDAAFDVVHKAFQDSKTKPGLQVLETLTRHLEIHPDEAVARSILQDSTLRTLTTLLIGTVPGHMKEACIIITCFLRKTMLFTVLPTLVERCVEANKVSWTHKLHEHNIPSSISEEHSSRGISPLLFALIFSSRLSEPRSASLKLLSLVCSREDKLEGSVQPGVLAGAVIQIYLAANTAALGDFAQDVLPVLLSNSARFQSFLEQFAPQADSQKSDLYTFLAVLYVGRMKSYVSEEGSDFPIGHTV